MKYSVKLSDTIHILMFIYLRGSCTLSSSKIAESIKTNPAYVRQLMSALKNAGIVSNSQGIASASLSKAPETITMLDIYKAVEGDKPLLHFDADTNPACEMGVNIQLSISDLYENIQTAIDQKLQSITLQDMIAIYENKSPCC